MCGSQGHEKGTTTICRLFVNYFYIINTLVPIVFKQILTQNLLKIKPKKNVWGDIISYNKTYSSVLTIIKTLLQPGVT